MGLMNLDAMSITGSRMMVCSDCVRKERNH
jgi:hypothetical protein